MSELLSKEEYRTLLEESCSKEEISEIIGRLEDKRTWK